METAAAVFAHLILVVETFNTAIVNRLIAMI
jgi:hypothetical protein